MKRKIAIILLLTFLFTGGFGKDAHAAAIELYSTSLYSDGNLTNYYRLEGNSNDSKGAANGTDTNVTYNASYGNFGQGATYTGNANSKSLATISTGLGSSFTVNVWANLQSSYWNFVFYSHVASYNNYWFALGDSGANKIRWQMYDGGQNPYMDTPSAVSSGVWHMITAVRDVATDKLYIYIDGVATGTPVTDTTTVTPTYSNFIIGNVNAANDNFTGYIDDFSIFSRALSATEIGQLYAGTLPGTSSVKANVILFE